jgi:hypothetical protein
MTLPIKIAAVGLSVLATVAASAQRAPSGIPRKPVPFISRKPVLGLPITKATQIKTYCSDSGAHFVDVYPATADLAEGLPNLYSVSTSSGGVQLVPRLMPHESGTASESMRTESDILDFFVAEHTLVTLVEFSVADANADKVAKDAGSRYYLSVSDLDGSSAKLVPLDIRFKPMKVALFGAGDYLLLGWDSINLQPLLAFIKEDGSVRRFVDFGKDQRQNAETYISQQEAQQSARTQSELKALEHSVLVPFGRKVLLTYPGTTRAVRMLDDRGEDDSIPIGYPAGLLLHDAIVSGGGYQLVLRLQEAPKPAPSGPSGDGQPAEPKTAERPQEYIFSFAMSGSNAGAALEEYLPSPAKPEEIVCGAGHHLSAIFWDTLPDASAAAPAVGDKTGAAADANVRLVIASTYR